MLSIREAAELLGMSERFVRREVKARRILSYKFGRPAESRLRHAVDLLAGAAPK